MNTTVAAITNTYPPRSNTLAVSGWVPIAEFDRVEKELRKDMRGLDMRVFYRGPRDTQTQHTKRKDATHAVIYYNRPQVQVQAAAQTVAAAKPGKASVKPSKAPSKADLIRAAIADCKRLAQGKDVAVLYGTAELGMKAALARTYVNNNWDKVIA